MFKEKENLFNVLFDAASEGIIVVDETQTMVAINNAIANMFGYGADELRGKPLNLLIPFRYKSQHVHHVKEFLKKSEKRRMGHGRDIYGIKKDGTEFPVEAGLNPFEWEGKKYVMSLIIDVSVRKEAQHQIYELNNELEGKIKSRTRELEESIAELEQVNQNLEQEIKRRKTAENKIKDAHKAEGLGKTFLSSIMNLLSQSLIIFVYIILLLIQKKIFINFLKKLSSNSSGMVSLLSDSAKIISSYLLGKGKIMTLLFGIYYLGFTLGSVPYALFLALFAALFSIVPYVGNIIGGGLAVILSYLYSGSTPALIVIGVISAAQLLENYVLTPWIIGDETNLNPFITIFGVILFSTLWGMVGAVIALPLIGVLKVIFEHTKEMEAYAYLIKKNDS